MGSADLVFQWRKSSLSGENGECVELGVPDRPAWRKSSRSGESGQCVELAGIGAVRDSKNPRSPMLRVDIDSFLDSIKTGGFDR